MTVRTWFRILRASAWNTNAPAPTIRIYFRPTTTADYGPAAPPVTLIDFHDYQSFLNKVDNGEGVPEHPDFVLRRMLAESDWSFSLRTRDLRKGIAE